MPHWKPKNILNLSQTIPQLKNHLTSRPGWCWWWWWVRTLILNPQKNKSLIQLKREVIHKKGNSRKPKCPPKLTFPQFDLSTGPLLVKLNIIFVYYVYCLNCWSHWFLVLSFVASLALVSGFLWRAQLAIGQWLATPGRLLLVLLVRFFSKVPWHATRCERD